MPRALHDGPHQQVDDGDTSIIQLDAERQTHQENYTLLNFT
jgi:hypothetical protein